MSGRSVDSEATRSLTSPPEARSPAASSLAADRRADVYAIGVMLWELCAASHLIPDEARARDRALRGTGIDHDPHREKVTHIE